MRLQTYRGPKYDKFMSSVGRAPAENATLVKKEAKQDERLVYWQEVTVDGLRHSDWLVTLGRRQPELAPFCILRLVLQHCPHRALEPTMPPAPQFS